MGLNIGAVVHFCMIVIDVCITLGEIPWGKLNDYKSFNRAKSELFKIKLVELEVENLNYVVV